MNLPWTSGPAAFGTAICSTAARIDLPVSEPSFANLCLPVPPDTPIDVAKDGGDAWVRWVSCSGAVSSSPRGTCARQNLGGSPAWGPWRTAMADHIHPVLAERLPALGEGWTTRLDQGDADYVLLTELMVRKCRVSRLSG